MFRIDAQHSFAPPQQGPDWYGKILARNKFAGSIYSPAEGSLEDALALAAAHPYIRRIVPALYSRQLAALPEHPLITSVHILDPNPGIVLTLQQRRLAIELNLQYTPLPTGIKVALLGIPEDPALPPNVYVKLTGFRLPATPAQKQKLAEMLRQTGPERLMFASGWPHEGGTWKETLAAFTQSLGPMPIELREQLLGGTAQAFYEL